MQTVVFGVQNNTREMLRMQQVMRRMQRGDWKNHERFDFAGKDDTRVHKSISPDFTIKKMRFKTASTGYPSCMILLEQLLNEVIDVAVLELAQLRQYEQFCVENGILERVQIASVLEREDVRSVLITGKKHKKTFVGSQIITYNQEMALQCEKMFDGIQCIMADTDLNQKENLQAMMEAVAAGELDGMLLPADLVHMLKLQRVRGLRYQYISPERILPTIGTAVTVLVVRKHDVLLDIFANLSDKRTMQLVALEDAIYQELYDTWDHYPLPERKEPVFLIYTQTQRHYMSVSGYMKLRQEKHFHTKGLIDEQELLIEQIVKEMQLLLE